MPLESDKHRDKHRAFSWNSDKTVLLSCRLVYVQSSGQKSWDPSCSVYSQPAPNSGKLTLRRHCPCIFLHRVNQVRCVNTLNSTVSRLCIYKMTVFKSLCMQPQVRQPLDDIKTATIGPERSLFTQVNNAKHAARPAACWSRM